MTAKIMNFTGRRVRQPLADNAPPNAQVPARAPVVQLTPQEHEKMQAWAEERMRDAIRVYRSMFTPQELVMRLARAAEDELRLIEGAL